MEGWFLRVTVEDESFSFIYHIMDPNDTEVGLATHVSPIHLHDRRTSP